MLIAQIFQGFLLKLAMDEEHLLALTERPRLHRHPTRKEQLQQTKHKQSTAYQEVFIASGRDCQIGGRNFRKLNQKYHAQYFMERHNIQNIQ